MVLRGPPLPAISAEIEMKSAPAAYLDQAESQSLGAGPQVPFDRDRAAHVRAVIGAR